MSKHSVIEEIDKYKIASIEKNRNKNDKPKDEPSKSSENSDDGFKLEHGHMEKNLIKWLARDDNNTRQKFGIGLYASEKQKILPIGIHKYSSDKNYTIIEYLDDDKKLAKEIGMDELIGMIEDRTGYWSEYDGTLRGKYCFKSRDCITAAGRLLRSGSKRINDIPLPMGFASSDGTFFDRRPYDPNLQATTKDFPLINSYLTRISNSKALCQIIGSALDGKPIKKRAIVLYGSTGLGKSAFYRFIKNMFGRSVVGVIPDVMDKHATAHYIPNNVIFIKDELDPKTFWKVMFKENTGSDEITVRPLGGGYKTVKVNGIHLFNINHDKLELPDDDAVVKSRILPCEITSNESWESTHKIVDDDVLDKKVEHEYEHFSGYCVYQFRSLLGKDVSFKDGDLEKYRDSSKADALKVMFESRFELVPLTKLQQVPGEVGKKTAPKWTVTNHEFTGIFEELALKYRSTAKDIKLKDLKDYIARDIGFTGGRIEIRQNGKHFIRGIRKKTNVEIDK